MMSDAGQATSFYYYDTIFIEHNNTDWVKYVVRFEDLPDSIHGSYVAIRSNQSSDYWYVYVDDITLSVIPNCSPIEDLVVDAGPVSAALTWTPIGSNYNGAEIEYKPTSSSSWSTLSVSGVNFATIPGLTPGTEYNLRVAASCDGGNSEYVTTVFSTPMFPCEVYDSTNLINVTIGTGTGTSNYIPSYSFYNYGYSQQFFTAHEIGNSGEITKISVFPTAVAQQRTYEIYMGYSSDSSASNFITPSHMTCVYNGGHIPLIANQWLDFELTSPFNYEADSGNLVVIFRDLTGSYVSGNAFQTSSAWSGAARYIYEDGSPYTPGAVTGGTSLSERNNMKFFGGTCLQASSCAAPPLVVTDVSPTTVDVAWAAGNTETSWNLSRPGRLSGRHHLCVPLRRYLYAPQRRAPHAHQHPGVCGQGLRR